MKELDLLLVEYLRQHWSRAGQDERQSFAQILELPDPVLAAYLLGNADCPEESLRPLLATLRGLAARGVQRAAGASRGTTPQQS
jgi:succinate dehydrogenase flavin-adding protein (antitoxin of CptAB toxin-antitoxin module)